MKTSKIAKESAQFVHVTTPRHLRSRDIALVQEHNESRRLDRDHEGVRSSKRKRNGTALESLTEEEIASSTEQLKQYGPIGDKMPKKARKQPARKRVSEDGKVKFDPPVNWKDFYNTTKDMRSQILAPVDTMGCESLAEEHRPPRDRRFQTLVALMLSSQTKDTVTSVAMKNLQQHLPGGFTLESVLQVEPGTLNDLIAKVGFHNNKTKFIKATAVILKEQHGGDIPSTIEGLLSLPGVGPKMAFLCMSAAWGRDEGIGVDVHVHRITNLWGWHKTSTPEETRIILESWLPRDKWHDINNLLVGFGQTWCPPVGRKCSECKLWERNLCPSAVVESRTRRPLRKERVSGAVKGVVSTMKKEQDFEHKTTTLGSSFIKSQDWQQPPVIITDVEDLGLNFSERRGVQ